jgi:hypothetical protein
MRNGLGRVLLGAGMALGLTLSVFAQNDATVVLRSGERMPAQNIGLFDGRQLIVRKSFEEEPRIPIDDVAYIDFGGTPDRQISLPEGVQAVTLRNGRILRGEVTRIAHTDQNDPKSPFLVTFRNANGGEQQLTGNEIGRVYFHEPGASAASGTSGFGRPRPRGFGGAAVNGDTRVITVPARQRWTSTGLTVNAGDQIEFGTSGEIRLNTDGVSASPDGALNGYHDPRSPMPQTLAGALIGRIGNGQPFGIGAMTQVQMPASGPLFLGVNDSNLNDNDGAFRVEIRMPYRH